MVYIRTRRIKDGVVHRRTAPLEPGGIRTWTDYSPYVVSEHHTVRLRGFLLIKWTEIKQCSATEVSTTKAVGRSTPCTLRKNYAPSAGFLICFAVSELSLYMPFILIIIMPIGQAKNNK